MMKPCLPDLRRARSALLALALLTGLAGGASAQGTWTTFLNGRGLSAAALDGDSIWAAGKGGVTRFPTAKSGKPEIIIREANGLPSNQVNSVDVAADGRIFFATQADGVARYDKRTHAWKVFDSAFGLPENFVTVVRDDGTNFLVGTRKGLAICSESDVLLTCTSLQDSCLPNLHVNDFIFGKPTGSHFGPYFVATDGGVVSFDGIAWKPMVSAALASQAVVALASRASDSTLYAATGQDVFTWQGGAWSLVAHSGPIISCLALDGDTLYVGRSTGVAKLVGGALQSIVDVHQGQELNQRAVSVQARAGTVWAATSNGLWKFSGDGWEDLFKSFGVDEPPFYNFYKIRVDPVAPHLVWCLPFPSNSLTFYNPAATVGPRWNTVTPPQGADDAQLGAHALVCDPSGDHYLGRCCVAADRRKGGMDLFQVQLTDPFQPGNITWQHFLNPPHNVLAIERDPRGRIWCGNGNSATEDNESLYVYTPSTGRWDGFTTRTPGWHLTSSRQFVLAFHGDDGWEGDFDGTGLAHWRVIGTDTTWTTYNLSGGTNSTHPLPSNAIRDIAFTGDTAWIGTLGGVTLVRSSSDTYLKSITADDGLPSNAVTAIVTAPDGDVWLGIGDVSGGGLVRVRNGELTIYNVENSPLVDNQVLTLAIDASRSPYELWVGTASGVNRLVVDGGSVSHPSTTSTLRFYPHPYRPTSGERLHLAGTYLSPASVKIYDARGRVVREFANVASGQAFWDGKDADGKPVGAGVYRVRIEADGQVYRLALAVIR